VDGKFFRGFINNLSETGVYVDTPESFTVGREITLSCPSIDTGGHIKRDGTIVRLTATGIAVDFQQDDLPK
jgi:Tfp pilus assembly protein PilZ